MNDSVCPERGAVEGLAQPGWRLLGISLNLLLSSSLAGRPRKG